MSTTEERAPRDAAPAELTPPSADAGAAATPEQLDDSDTAIADPHDALSPAVRRLVRQFDLDITGIHGTGPSGRIRVGDVMGLLVGRTDSGNRDAPVRAAAPDDEAPVPDDDGTETESAPFAATAGPLVANASAQTAIPMSTVFDCGSRNSSTTAGCCGAT